MADSLREWVRERYVSTSGGVSIRGGAIGEDILSATLLAWISSTIAVALAVYQFYIGVIEGFGLWAARLVSIPTSGYAEVIDESWRSAGRAVGEFGLLAPLVALVLVLVVLGLIARWRD